MGNIIAVKHQHQVKTLYSVYNVQNITTSLYVKIKKAINGTSSMKM